MVGRREIIFMSVGKKICAGVLSLMFIFAITSQASAQHWRRDRGLSTGQKAAIIGGGAAAGALIGGLAGGKKGAIIGGLLGGGAGTGAVILKDHNDRERWEDRYRYRRYREFRDNRYYRERRFFVNDGRFFGGRDRWRR